jgi:hypothetical protein
MTYLLSSFVRAFLVAVFFLGSAIGKDVGVLHLPSLKLILPPTWTFDGSKNPIEGFGPDGEKLLISVIRLRPGATDSKSFISMKDEATNFAKDKLPVIATKNGLVALRQVTPFPTLDGKVAFASVSEKSSFFSGKYFFLQYLLANDVTMIFFTVEGKGDALLAAERFDQYMKTQQWE